MKVNLLKEKQKLNKNEIGIKNKEKSGFRFKNQIKKEEKEEEQEVIETDNNVMYDKIKEKLEKKQDIYDKLKTLDKDADILNCSDEENIPMKNMKEKFLIYFESDKDGTSDLFNKRGKYFQKERFNFNNNFKIENYSNSNRALNNNDYIHDSELNESYMNIEHAPKVKQSYDKVLSEAEKDALNIVKYEENEYKKNLEFLRKKKNKEREERLERIKKMKIE